MQSRDSEVERRTRAALAESRRVLGKPGAEHSVTLFVEHHIKEVPPTYWQDHCGTPNPSPLQVLDILTLQGHWGVDEETEAFGIDDDRLDVFDFTLPDQVTQYVLTVHFDADGAIQSVEMES